MNSYRDWLHARSTCPVCQATGMETKKSIYTCPACRHQWRVNEARICSLRRYHIQK
jgi:DnaJ-class molecular chaperone